MLRGFKFRIYPNKEQKEYFEKVFDCSRFIYNFYLHEKTKHYLANKNNKEKPKFKYTSEKILKEQYGFLKESDATSLLKSPERYALFRGVYEWQNILKYRKI